MWKERALERLAAGWSGGVVAVRASEHRSQWRNRETAAVRLASLLAEATAPPPKAAPGDADPARDQRAAAAGEEAARRDQARAATARGWNRIRAGRAAGAAARAAGLSSDCR